MRFSKSMRCRYFMLCLLAFFMFLAVIGTPSCKASTWIVKTDADDGSTDSLRGVIASADSGDIIEFSSDIGGTIALSSQLEIAKNLNILGPGSGDLAISGGGSCRVFYIENCSVDISGLSIVSGDVSSSVYGGGGIRSNSADLTLENCKVSDNTAKWYGGGFCGESGAVTNIINCIFSGNTVTYFGGGLYNDSSSSADITGCTINDNMAGSGGGGLYNYASSVDISNCTVSGNTLDDSRSGAGIYNEGSSTKITNCTLSNNEGKASGGGIYNKESSADVTNCTFIDNVAGIYGAGIYNGFDSSVEITNCTFTDNSAGGKGSSVYNRSDSSLSIVNCILWDSGTSEIYTGNKDGSAISYCVVSGDVSSADYTLSESIITDDPMLDDLADNGGDTKTCALISGSPAIDTGTSDGAPDEDQRGISRPQGAGYDIGAYEVKEDVSSSSDSSGCSIGYIGPAALLLLAPLWYLLKKR